jgi:hypothetical protein
MSERDVETGERERQKAKKKKKEREKMSDDKASFWHSRSRLSGQSRLTSAPRGVKETSTKSNSGHVLVRDGGTPVYSDLTLPLPTNQEKCQVENAIHQKEMVRIHHLWNETRSRLRDCENELIDTRAKAYIFISFFNFFFIFR